MSRLSEQRIEPARRVERRKVVAAADMPAVDEDLRHGAPPAGAPDHRVEAVAIHRHIDFAIGRALAVEQPLRPRAIGAEKFRINFDRCHAAITSSFPAAYRNRAPQSKMPCRHAPRAPRERSEAHTSALKSLIRPSYAV